MAINVSAWSIKRPTPIILLFLVLTIMGGLAYRGLGINDMPDVDFPTVIIQISEPGAAPTELETEVTRKVEDSLIGIAHLDHIRSVVSEGLSATTVEFEVGSSSETGLNDVRDAVSRIRQQLPGDIQEPQITHPNGSGDPFITWTIASDKRSVSELSRFVDEDLTRALLSAPGIAQVQRSGGQTREVQVKLDPSRVTAVGATVDSINAQLKALNVNLPGGRADIGGQEQGVRTLGSAKSIDDLRALRIALPNGTSVRLDTLGTVQDTNAEVRQIARMDGQPVVAFSLQRALGAPLVQTEEGAVKALAEFEKTMPADMHIQLVRTLGNYSRAQFKASRDALFMGAFLAICVIVVFLKNWQATLISAFAIPLSIIATFSVMKWLGYTLNSMTMIGLTLVVGILVDDAIVDLENIHRHMAMGKSPMKAAFEATDEIGLAVVATTMTIVAVFIPVAFMGGIPGMFFRSFALTVTVSVLFSLLVARTLTPMMAAYILPDHPPETEKEPFYAIWYMRILKSALHHRAITVFLALVIFFCSLGLAPLIPKGLFSNGDVGEAVVAIALPEGSTLEETRAVVERTDAILRSHPEVAHVFATIGTSGGTNWAGSSGASVASASLNCMMVPKSKRSISTDEFASKMSPVLRQIPGARISITAAGGVGGGKAVNLILRGSDPEALDRVGTALLGQMRGLTDLRDVTSSAAEQRPELIIHPDFAKAAEQGVSVQTIGRLARLATQGDVDFNLAKYNAGDQQINLRVQLAESARDNLAAIGDLRVPGKQGLIPLSAVATITLGTGPVQLSRYDRARQVTFSANTANGAALGDATAKIQALPALRNLPASVMQDSQGQTKIMADIFGGFAFAMGTGVLFIFAVLVLLFGSFLQPLTIMAALPLSIGGALAGLLIGHKELGMMGLIGILMLMGLVTKNSILLVEYAIMSRHNGLERYDALLHAGRDRLRPILMTTIAMIAGMLPIAFSIGEGTERLAPMAAAVIGGLVTSTLLTLVVVPAVYTYVDDFQELLKRGFNRLARRQPAPPEGPGTPPRARERQAL
jgi:HAE1 family hydrophobic/amphiphilic exporter-1